MNRRVLRLALLSLVCAQGCSGSLGAASSHVVHGQKVFAAGLKSQTLADVTLFDGPSLTLGTEAVLLQRIDPGDEVGQWRFSGLGGVTQMPRPHEFPIGWEALLGAGIARVYDDGRAEFRGLFGLQAGLPIRLSSGDPLWRSDDFVGSDFYLVPSIGGHYFPTDTLEWNASLSIRFHMWSAALP